MAEKVTTGGPATIPGQAAELSPLDSAPPRRGSHRAWVRFRRHKMAMISVGCILFFVVLAIFADLIAPSPTRMDVRALGQAPSAQHIMGTDRVGRDTWARLVHASRVSVSVGLIAVSIYITIGTVLGAISGYFGGIVDMVIQRITETVMTFPTLMIIITVVSLVGPSINNVFLAIGLLGWPWVCRLVRAEFLSLRERDFVLAARCLGVATPRIVFRHILPNVVAPIIVAATLGVAGAILTETGLSFLGLGVQPPTPSWGNMITDATTASVLEGLPWLWLAPGLAITICVLAFNFVGDGLRDALDPRMSL